MSAGYFKVDQKKRDYGMCVEKQGRGRERKTGNDKR